MNILYRGHFGDDLTVVNAARVSLDLESDWDYTPEEKEGTVTVARSLKQKDARLIRYLADHGHWTPFGQVYFRFRIRMPIPIARQWYKHTVGFNRNEVSRRYIKSNPTFLHPKQWRTAPTGNVKQGSGGAFNSEESAEISSFYDEKIAEAEYAYKALLDRGVCPEQARFVLPQAMYTEFEETGSLYAYARLCRLRLDGHAQKEIQEYAQIISQHIGHYCPVSWDALMGTLDDRIFLALRKYLVSKDTADLLVLEELMKRKDHS